MREKSQVILPLDLGICIPEGDFVFKVVEICERLDYTELWATYVRAWRKANPVTMFEILIFAYMNGIFSSREIEQACKTDIRFMWLLTRGKRNVETQFFLLAFALNIQKLCNREKSGRIGLDLFPLNAS